MRRDKRPAKATLARLPWATNGKTPLALLALLGCASLGLGRDYYVHPKAGDDAFPGTREQPLRSLARITTLDLQPGDTVQLARGHTFFDTLQLRTLSGTPDQPILVGSYAASGETQAEMPTINARGQANGILVSNCSNIRIQNIRIEADGGGYPGAYRSAPQMRCGALVSCTQPGSYRNIALSGLTIENVYFQDKGFERGTEEVRTPNGTQAYGWGIRVVNPTRGATLEGVTIENCSVSNVAHTGIKFTGRDKNIRDITLSGNRVFETGGPGMQMSEVSNARVRGNAVDRSGSSDDSRKWGRGSGLWTWGSNDVLVEHNSFRNANGPGDSAGCHIDFNCRNVVVQYNVSENNAGGFCEILGNNYNCSYRYNVSINDGRRVKGRDGAFQEGKVFWLSGYAGKKNPRNGPFNTYFYNNTIYVPPGNVAKIAVDKAASGILIANNIFCFEGESSAVKGDQYKPEKSLHGKIPNVVFKNNLYLNAQNWPEAVAITDAAPLLGDPQFRNAQGASPADFTPQNESLVKDRGIPIEAIPGDRYGLSTGLQATHDILGNAIEGDPDLGAIELTSKK